MVKYKIELMNYRAQGCKRLPKKWLIVVATSFWQKSSSPVFPYAHSTCQTCRTLFCLPSRKISRLFLSFSYIPIDLNLPPNFVLNTKTIAPSMHNHGRGVRSFVDVNLPVPGYRKHFHPMWHTAHTVDKALTAHSNRTPRQFRCPHCRNGLQNAQPHRANHPFARWEAV